jgi:hypothetical protein
VAECRVRSESIQADLVSRDGKRLPNASLGEYERLSTEREEFRKESDQLKAALEERAKAERNRIELVSELRQLRDEGDILLRHYSDDDLEDWWKRISGLIGRALPKDRADEYLKHGLRAAQQNAKTSESRSKEQIRAQYMLDRLPDLISEANRFTPRLDLRQDFDIQEYRQ